MQEQRPAWGQYKPLSRPAYGLAPIIAQFGGLPAFSSRPAAHAHGRGPACPPVNPALPTSVLRTGASFSQREFRDALGQFATGVTVITARSPEGHPVGTTISSFNSLSLTPPLVLWSLGLHANALPVFQRCTRYAIHVLSAAQKPLAELFARRGADRFGHTAHHDSVHGVPLLEGCAAIFECRNRNRHDEGDHVIFIGEVERCEHHRDRAPLLYHAGHMHTRGL